MADAFFVKLNKKNNFNKSSGRVEIHALLNPNINTKHFIPIYGSAALSPCVVDNSCMKYVVFAEKCYHIKTFDFVPCFSIDKTFVTYFPFPEDYIMAKLTKKEKSDLFFNLNSCQNQEVKFFQVLVKNEK